jgi:predicted MPP superfamily phosphohydrolase
MRRVRVAITGLGVLLGAWGFLVEPNRLVVRRSAAPVLLLTHNPDVFPDVPARVSLTLAGHTHGGQVRLPLIGAPVVPSVYGQRYAAGLVVEGGRALFVTTGIGTSIVPLRIGVPPEIAVLRVVPASATTFDSRRP